MTATLLVTAGRFRGLLSAFFGTLARAWRGHPLRKPILMVNPKHAGLLREAGLTSVEDFLELPETIVSGHPNRQVSRVTLGRLGGGPGAVPAFLKKEHRVPWKERLANAWAGFGPVSKSLREALTLRDLPPAVSAPEWVAAGESTDGRAFLLVREVQGAVELRCFLDGRRHQPGARWFAHKLGVFLAQVHDTGCFHGDLYANHVLVAPETEDVFLVDWQRSVRCGAVSLRQRWHDLAALTATLTPELAGPRDRLACLRAYLAQSGLGDGLLRRAIAVIASIEEGMRRRRHVRAKSLPPLQPGSQSLLCLDGSALNVTAAFRALWPSSLPHYLSWPALQQFDGESEVLLPDGGCGLLVCGRRQLPGPGRHQVTPERRRMSTLFRLQRYGIEAPQVLAVGERPLSQSQAAGDVVSFLLTRPPPDTLPLGTWLAAAQHRWRQQVLGDAGVLLARLHQAGCYFRRGPDGLAVQVRPGKSPRVVLERADGLDVRRHFRGLWQRRNLAQVWRVLAAAGASVADHRQLLRGYDSCRLRPGSSTPAGNC
jgi:tRNA A-37 threonylcarbamoyl transferase component Bud32